MSWRKFLPIVFLLFFAGILVPSVNAQQVVVAYGPRVQYIQQYGLRPLNFVEARTGPYVSGVLHETRNVVRSLIALPPLAHPPCACGPACKCVDCRCSY